MISELNVEIDILSLELNVEIDILSLELLLLSANDSVGVHQIL